MLQAILCIPGLEEEREERRGKEVIVQMGWAWASPVTSNPKPGLPQEDSFCGTWHYPRFWYINSFQTCTWKALQPDWFGAELLGCALILHSS